MDGERLNAWIQSQGVPVDPLVQAMLLAQERFYGRTHERGVDRERARRQLEQLTDRYEGSLPQQQRNEYPGMAELRAYVTRRRLAQEQARETERLERAREELSQPEAEAMDPEDQVLAQNRNNSRGR